MFVCETCSSNHLGDFGSGRFCCLKCSRSFSTLKNRDEINKKRSAALKGKTTNKTFKCDDCSKYFASSFSLFGHKAGCNSNLVKIERLKHIERRRDNLVMVSFDSIMPSLKKERIFLEQEGKCNRCHLDKWLGQLISLELEHKDGDTNNNTRENLELLCPNCHSMTDTWRGRNKNKGKSGKRVNDEDLIQALKNSVSIRQALISVGLSPKGDNYIRAKKLKGAIAQ